MFFFLEIHQLWDIVIVSCVISQARAKYLSVAKQMKAYEDVQYAQWHHEVETKLPSLLKRNLLAKPEVSASPTVMIKVDEETGEKSDLDAGWCLTPFYFNIFLLLFWVKLTSQHFLDEISEI